MQTDSRKKDSHNVAELRARNVKIKRFNRSLAQIPLNSSQLLTPFAQPNLLSSQIRPIQIRYTLCFLISC